MVNAQHLTKTIGFMLMITGCLVAQVGISSPKEHWPEALTTHRVAKSSLIEEVWSRSNVIAKYDWINWQLSAADGKVFFLGSLARDENISIISLEAKNGELLWRRGRGGKSVVRAMSNGLYVGEVADSVAQVTRYELDTGESVWSKRFEESNTVLYLDVEDNQVSAYLNPNYFLLLEGDTGKPIRKYRNDDPIFLSTNELTYVRQPYSNSLRAIRNETGDMLWEAHFDDRILQSPLFTEDVIYVRTEEALGRVYAVDRLTGLILWATERIAVSNVAAKKAVVFLLTMDGRLVCYDRYTGKEVGYAEFDPSPFLLAGDSDAQGYYVAYDEKTNIIFALLGDSYQLFAFNVSDE